MDTAYQLLDLRPLVKTALEGLSDEISYTVCQSYPEEESGGNQLIYREFSNISTDSPVVDRVTMQVELWCEEQGILLELAELVNKAMLSLGLRRTYTGADEITNSGSHRRHKVYRFGRKIDKRTLRPID